VQFIPAQLAGAYLIELEAYHDERGYFMRTWCRRELSEQGLNADLVQCSLSHNRRRGTVRGMHYQRPPHGETKIVRCSRGAIFDIIIDLRPDSPTHQRWQGFELTAENHRMLYIPPGMAHGFITLVDDSDVAYMMSDWHEPSSAAGVRWNDPQFDVRWPIPVAVIADRDKNYPDYSP